jgi:hypothetical protein
MIGAAPSREVHVADVKSKTPNPFDPQALLEAQRRNLDAFTNAGQIVADGMRTYAERQVAMVQESMQTLWSELQANAQKPQAATAPAEQLLCSRRPRMPSRRPLARPVPWSTR